ncbi:MAG: PepSY domain-containing protein, partial [Proteobacteria bacterium]
SYDLHRAGGLWLWPLLIVMAASSVYLNLAHEVFVPVVEAIASVVLPKSARLGVTEAILEWQQPLHTGQAFGLAGQIVVSLTGLLVVILALTGLRTTWRKLVRAGVSRPSSSSSGPARPAAPSPASARRRSPRSA